MVLPSNALLAAQSPKRIFVLFAPPSTFPRASVLPSGSPPPLPSGPGSLPPRQILDFRETALDLPENMDYPPVSAHSFRCGNGFGEILDRNGPIWCILRPPGPGLHRRSLARFLGSTSDSLAFLQSSTRSPHPPGAPLAEIWRKWPTGAGALGTTPSDSQELFRVDPRAHLHAPPGSRILDQDPPNGLPSWTDNALLLNASLELSCRGEYESPRSLKFLMHPYAALQQAPIPVITPG
ncbi:hypothetical protein R3P38DRAFT_2800010 [Favolaschia claudopus]|uniref:Uncharacterized protein n=1 Tax=Favolaschia claudopus TaxID=2862362 RepID=A0AAV9ZZ52_9AGAR